MSKHKTRNNPLFRLTLCAMLIAMSVVLCRLLGYSPGSSVYRVEAGFLPIAAVAVLYGPVWSGLAYALSDLIGAAVTTGINPFITLCKAALGVWMGLFFYTRRPRMGKGEVLLRDVLCFTTGGALIDVFCMGAVFVFMGYSANFAQAFADRGINALINLPLRVVLFFLFYLAAGKLLAKYKTEKVLHL